jgi:hypothetical protein
MKTIKEVVERYLLDNEYDGLYNERGECACFIDDLMPCGCDCESCIAGYKFECQNCDFFGISSDPENFICPECGE